MTAFTPTTDTADHTKWLYGGRVFKLYKQQTITEDVQVAPQKFREQTRDIDVLIGVVELSEELASQLSVNNGLTVVPV